MSNSHSVSETELDSNSDYKIELTTTTDFTASSSNISKDSVNQSEHKVHTTDSVTQSEYEHTYVHSLKTLAYLAWVGWPRPRDPRDCDCGCIVDGKRMAKPHFRARTLSQMRYPYLS